MTKAEFKSSGVKLSGPKALMNQLWGSHEVDVVLEEGELAPDFVG